MIRYYHLPHQRLTQRALRNLDRSDGLVVKRALPTIRTAEEDDRSSAWPLVVRVQETLGCGRGEVSRTPSTSKGPSDHHPHLRVLSGRYVRAYTCTGT
jgi:hypothetical protein